MVSPRIITFDIFGTVVDWYRGLTDDLANHGHALGPSEFGRVIARQAELEQQKPFRSYRDVTAQSLTDVLRVSSVDGYAIGGELGRWPLFPDSRAALRHLMRGVRCAAMTNGDRIHGWQVQETLGFELSAWVCAEDLRLYKRARRFWHAAAELLGTQPGEAWWHVSACGDDDLAVASALGLTTVFVRRPHSRPRAATYSVEDLGALVELATS